TAGETLTLTLSLRGEGTFGLHQPWSDTPSQKGRGRGLGPLAPSPVRRPPPEDSGVPVPVLSGANGEHARRLARNDQPLGDGPDFARLAEPQVRHVLGHRFLEVEVALLALVAVQGGGGGPDEVVHLRVAVLVAVQGAGEVAAQRVVRVQIQAERQVEGGSIRL